MLQIPLPEAAPADTIAAGATKAGELAALKSMSFDELINKLVSDMVHFAISLAVAILVFYVGKFIITRLYNFTAMVMLRRNVDESLSTFILSLLRIVLYFILIVTVIGILGIPTSSFLALFASAGVAIGMALSGTLQNFAGGVLILLLKPYRVGDYIEAGGYAGTVREIQIFSTIINTSDNKSIIIPNGGLSTGSINNWSRQSHRRVQWDIGVAYGTDFDHARKVILDILASNPDVLDGDSANETRFCDTCTTCGQAIPRSTEAATPSQVTSATEGAKEPTKGADAAEPAKKRGFWRSLFRSERALREQLAKARTESVVDIANRPINFTPAVMLGALADSSVNLTVRVWVRSDKFWSVFYDVNEKIYRILPENGIEFPFPQLDVHIQSPGGTVPSPNQ